MAVPPGLLREDLAQQVAEGKITFSEMVQMQGQPAQATVQSVTPPQAAPVQNAKVAVCFPTTYDVSAVFCFNMFPVWKAAPDNTIMLVNWKYGVAESRQYMVNEVLANHTDVTHIMFMDNDMIPLDINIIKILLAVNVPMVGAMYWNSFNGGVNAWLNGQVIQQEQPAPVVQVDQIGIGACLIKVDVFKQLEAAGIKRPWFKFHIGDKPGEFMGEDMHFQLLLKKINIRPFVHTKCICHHYKPMEFDINGAGVYRQPSMQL